MQYNPEYHAWFSQLSTYRCQTLALSRRCYISETAQPYQTGANRCSSTATESGRPSKKCFKQKETSYVPLPTCRHDGSGVVDENPPSMASATNYFICGARERTYPAYSMARASPYRSVKSVITTPDIKLFVVPGESTRDPTSRAGGWRNVELSNCG